MSNGVSQSFATISTTNIRFPIQMYLMLESITLQKVSLEHKLIYVETQNSMSKHYAYFKKSQ